MKDLDKLERKLEISIGESITRSETNIMAAVDIVISRKLQMLYIGWGVIIIALLLILASIWIAEIKYEKTNLWTF